MQASTRIGIALCVLVAGVTIAGLFRKTPQEASSPADEADDQLALRQPSAAALPTQSITSGSWRQRAAEASGATSSPRTSAPTATIERAPAAPPLPLPTVPREAAVAVDRGAPSASATSSLSGPATAASARVAPADTDDDWQLHEVADGDTLAALAQRYYGDTSLAEAILRANGVLVKNADILPIGAFLKIPSRRSVGAATAARPLQGQAGDGWRKATGQRP
jgi:phage tail protein X